MFCSYEIYSDIFILFDNILHFSLVFFRIITFDFYVDAMRWNVEIWIVSMAYAVRIAIFYPFILGPQYA